jgi:hypothetical protein
MLTAPHPADQTAAPKEEQRCLPTCTSPYLRRPSMAPPVPPTSILAPHRFTRRSLTCACAGDPGAGHLAEQCCDPPGSQWLQAAALRRVDPAAVNMLSHQHTALRPRQRASFSASK